MSVREQPVYDVRTLARLMSTSDVMQSVDPDLACIPVHVPFRGAALLVGLDGDAINSRYARQADPIVLVYCYSAPHQRRTWVAKVHMSFISLLCDAHDPIVAELREIAGVRDPNARWLVQPYRNAI